MPVQVDNNRFAAYRYNPDYLRNFMQYRNKITDGNGIMVNLGLEYDNLLTDIVIDGGNVVRCGDKVVMTAKVFEENPSIRPFALLERLEAAFDADVIVLPWDTTETYGHADGICRYAGDGTIILTNYRQFDEKMGNRFYNCLKHNFDNVLELSYEEQYFHNESWAYINWLQTDKIIIVPGFGREADRQAINQIEKVMPSYRDKIVLCECSDLVKHDGALNCCSWTIME